MPARARFIDFRSSLGPQTVGLCATDLNSLIMLANEAEQRLIIDPLAPEEGWYGQYAQMAFNVSRLDPFIVAPQNIARIIALDVCKHPVQIENQFYEFLTFGSGLQPKGCTTGSGSPLNPWCQSPLRVYERNTVTTFAPLVGTKIIRAYITDPADLGRTALIQGTDSNGQIVRFLDALANASGIGESITFDQPFTDTANQFTGELIGVQKQKTYGEVQFFQVDSATGQETPLLVMAPSETTASYRRYYINNLPQRCSTVPCGTPLQIETMVKMDFVPITCDADYLNLGCVPALIEECQAVRFSRMDIPGAQQLSQAHHGKALGLLFGRLQHYLGNEKPALQRKLWGSDCMRLQPL